MTDFDETRFVSLLIFRLERISADSYWAHRASGIRGVLLRELEKLENGRPIQRSELKRMLELGFFILQRAAEERKSSSIDHPSTDLEMANGHQKNMRNN